MGAAGGLLLVAVLALAVAPQNVAPFSLPIGLPVALSDPARALCCTRVLLTRVQMDAEQVRTSSGFSSQPPCGTAARCRFSAPRIGCRRAPTAAYQYRLGSTGGESMDFDFESAAEDSSEDGLDTAQLQEKMLNNLRDEAVQYQDVPMLRAQMQKHVLSRDSLSEVISSILASKISSSDLSEAQVFEVLVTVMRGHPQLQVNAVKDLEWCREVDPATIGYLQPLLYFKGVQAVLLQRVAHQLWQSRDKSKKMMALAFQSRGSEVFGVDAHPGAVIKHAVMLDHATGTVIGETGTIGFQCYILHSVTLGSTGKGDKFDRHPKIGNRVKIGAGAKVLGNVRIENDAFIGAGAIVTVNVKEGETVVGINRILDRATKAANVNYLNQDTWLYTI